MNADTKVDLGELHQAVLDRIAGEFPALQTVEDYRELRSELALPAVLVNLEDFEAVPESDPLTGQLAVMSRWRAQIVIGFRTDVAQREIRRLAAAIGLFIQGQRWGEAVAPAEVLLIAPDDFEPALDQFVVWSVEWQQIIHLGESVWGGGEMPERVLVSWVPKVGIPHEGDYVEIGGSDP